VIVLGLTGKAGSGKDTVADYLVEHYGYEKLAFAAPLKRVAYQANPILGMDIYHPGNTITLQHAIDELGEDGVKKVYPQYRTFLQKLGTEGIRSIDPDFWVKAALQSLTTDSGKYVFTDVRFPNEAKAIRSLSGELWHVVRPNVTPGPEHSSEAWAGNLNENFTIENDFTLEWLHKIVDHAVNTQEVRAA